jgi:hypothetical protein
MVLKSKMVAMTGYVICMAEKRNTYKMLVEKFAEKGLLEKPSVGGSIISQEVLGRTNSLLSFHCNLSI